MKNYFHTNDKKIGRKRVPLFNTSRGVKGLSLLAIPHDFIVGGRDAMMDHLDKL